MFPELLSSRIITFFRALTKGQLGMLKGQGEKNKTFISEKEVGYYCLKEVVLKMLN